jgi:hypothetical protein
LEIGFGEQVEDIAIGAAGFLDGAFHVC